MEGDGGSEEKERNNLSDNQMSLRKALVYFATALVFAACSPKIIYLPGENHTVVEYRDSVVVRTDTVSVPVPVETVKEVADRLGVLQMETSVAEAKAWLDPDAEILRGEMRNKNTALQKEVIYKDRYITRDSLVYVKEPYPVEVEKIVKVTPKWAWYSLIFSLLTLVAAGAYVFLKVKKIV